MKCGESRGHLLDYHHLDPSTKENTIARLTSNTSSVQKIEEEIVVEPIEKVERKKRQRRYVRLWNLYRRCA